MTPSPLDEFTRMRSRTTPNGPPETTSRVRKTLTLLLLTASLVACGVANRALLAFGDSSSQLTGTDQLFFDLTGRSTP